MGPAALVREAAARFIEGDDARFAECFDPAVTVYGEPEVANTPVVASRAELTEFIARVRASQPDLSVTLGEVSEEGTGVVAETMIVTEDVWRLALAVCVSDELICDVHAFRDPRAAVSWLGSHN